MKRYWIPYAVLPVMVIFITVLMYLKYGTHVFGVTDITGRHRGPVELMDHFRVIRTDLEPLTQELQTYADRGLLRIDHDRTRPEDVSSLGISRRKLRQLRREFRRLDAPRGVLCTPTSVAYITHTSGLSVAGYAEGLVYSEEEPVNRYERIGRYPASPFERPDDVSVPAEGSYRIHVRIDGNWYVFMEHDG